MSRSDACVGSTLDCIYNNDNNTRISEPSDQLACASGYAITTRSAKFGASFLLASRTLEIGSVVCLVRSHLAIASRSWVWSLAVETGSLISSCKMKQKYSAGGVSVWRRRVACGALSRGDRLQEAPRLWLFHLDILGLLHHGIGILLQLLDCQQISNTLLTCRWRLLRLRFDSRLSMQIKLRLQFRILLTQCQSSGPNRRPSCCPTFRPPTAPPAFIAKPPPGAGAGWQALYTGVPTAETSMQLDSASASHRGAAASLLDQSELHGGFHYKAELPVSA